MKEKIFEVPGIPDEYFDRGNLPMTKEEVRCITVSKLRLSQDSIVYDVGAGTGKPETPVGIVKNIGREGETVIVTDLQHMLEYQIDMVTTVIIGNSSTFVKNDRMITPRGYEV